MPKNWDVEPDDYFESSGLPSVPRASLEQHAQMRLRQVEQEAASLRLKLAGTEATLREAERGLASLRQRLEEAQSNEVGEFDALVACEKQRQELEARASQAEAALAELQKQLDELRDANMRGEIQRRRSPRAE